MESTIIQSYIMTVGGTKPCPIPEYTTQSPIIRIDKKEGTVFLNRKLDYEKESFLTAEITFRCGVQQSTVTLEIEVVNENDEPPRFNTRDGEIFNVNENIIGPFAIIEANDPDSDFIFEIVDNDVFEIDSASGLLTLKLKLDYESTPLHGLRVTARDKAGNLDAINVIIKVKNRAEYPPTFSNRLKLKNLITVKG